MADKNAVQATIEELDKLEKSEQEIDDDGIAALEKALAELDDFDALSKSEDMDKDDEGEDDKGDNDEDNNGGPSDGDEDNEDTKKSLSDEELEQELVKASEAYAELEGTVHALAKSQGDQLDEVRSALATLTGLTLSIGKGVVSLSKSLKTFGAQPVTSGKKPLLGEGRLSDELVKSQSEVIDLIKSAVEAETIPAIWLSKVAVNGPGCLPDNIKQIIGL